MLLQQSASPDLEARLFNVLLDQLTGFPESYMLDLKSLATPKSVPVGVTSAYPLNEKMRSQLEQKLGSLINHPLTIQYHQNQSLLAGLRLDMGAWAINANLQHELIGFAEIAYEPE
jgi:F-type H+-transporting ATPase subunit b